MKSLDALLAAAGHPFTRVVGVAAPNHDHRLHLLQQRVERLLVIGRGMANRIDEANVGGTGFLRPYGIANFTYQPRGGW